MAMHPTEWDAETFGTLVCDGKKVFEPADRSRTFQTSRANTHKKHTQVTGTGWVRLSVAFLSVVIHRQWR